MRFIDPSDASTTKAFEELEPTLVDNLWSFWSPLKASVRFFFFMDKISYWLREVLEEMSWITGSLLSSASPSGCFCFATKGIDSTVGFNFFPSALVFSFYMSVFSSVCCSFCFKLSWTEVRVSLKSSFLWGDNSLVSSWFSGFVFGSSIM